MDIPKAVMTDYGKAAFATEVAFNDLLQQARIAGLQVGQVMGLEYLPDEKLSEDFKMACRAILLSLTPVSSHITGSDGKQYWNNDGDVPVK